MSKSGLAGSAVAMASGTLVSRLLGLVKGVLLLAAISSVGGAANAFSVANKLPNIVYMLIAGGVLNAVLVPQIVRAMRREDGGFRYVNRLLTLAGTTLFVVTAILTAGSAILLTIYANSISPEWRPVAMAFAYLCMPQLFFFGLYTLLGQVLNARGNFGPYMWAPALNNVVAIAGLGTYLLIYGRYAAGSGMTPAEWSGPRILLFAGTATLGVIAQALILVIPLWRSGFRFRPDFHFRGVGLGKTSKVAMWAFAALGVGQIGYVAISNLAMAAGATEVPAGQPHLPGNGSYDSAFMVFMLPQSLITVSLVTAIFTRLSHHAAAGAGAKVRADLSFGLRTLAVFTVFATGALMVLAIPTVTVITAGQVSWQEQRWIGHIVVGFASGLVAIGAWTMIQRIYYAYEDTQSLFRIQLPMMVIIVGGCGLSFWLLDPEWWVVGSAVATTASNALGALIAYLALRRKLPSLDGARVVRTHFRLVLAVLPAVAVGWGLLWLWGAQGSVIGALARVLVLGTVMAAIYLVLVHRLQVSELDALMARIGRILAPISARLAPRLSRIPGTQIVRTIGTRIGPARFQGAPSQDSEQGAGTAVSQTPMHADEVIAERYRLIEAESGVFPPTWIAEDEILARNVRIALIPEQFQDEALNAARRSALVTDPRLPRVHRVGISDGHAFVVTDDTDDIRLDHLLAHGPLPPSQAQAVIAEAAAAIDTARRRGMHHLALDPTTIGITREGGVRVHGLGYRRAALGISAGESKANARRDAVALVQLIYAALTGAWPGPAPAAGAMSNASWAGADAEPSIQAVGSTLTDIPDHLVTLCSTTLGDEGQGPMTAGEFMRQLAPWEQVTAPAGAHVHPARTPSDPGPRSDGTAILTEDPQTGEFSAVPTGAPAGSGYENLESDSAGEATFDELIAPASQTASVYSARHVNIHSDPPHQSPAASDGQVRATGWDLPSANHPDGSEPRYRSPSPARPDEAVSSLAPAPTRHFQAPTHQPTTAGPDSTAASDLPEEPRNSAREPQRRSSHKSGGRVLLIMIAIVVFGIVLSINALKAPFASKSDLTSATPTPAPETSHEASPPGALPTISPEPEESKEGPAPITDGITVDPGSSEGENQDIAYYAYDDDRSTFWRSLRYNDPHYGMKNGLGFAVELEEEWDVNEVVVDVLGEGGYVEIRDADVDEPTAGPVLAEGPLGPEKSFEFDEAVETDTIMLWFTELPTAESDGRNRIELAEVQVR